MSIIEQTAAFVSISSFSYGMVNWTVSWGSRLTKWIPSHSNCAIAIAGGLAGAGNGVILSALAFFPRQENQFWDQQGLESAHARFVMRLTIIFSVPFFMAMLFTMPVASLFGRQISLKTVTLYGAFDGALCLVNYYLMKSNYS